MGEKKQWKTVITVPVRFSGNTVAVVGIDVPLSTFKPIVQGLKLYETGYAFIVASNAKGVAHPTTDAIIGVPMADHGFKAEVIDAVKSGREASQYMTSKVTKKENFFQLLGCFRLK
ncbi:MAG: cache domain-containing protein [Anaerolineales bacterium]